MITGLAGRLVSGAFASSRQAFCLCCYALVLLFAPVPNQHEILVAGSALASAFVIGTGHGDGTSDA